MTLTAESMAARLAALEHTLRRYLPIESVTLVDATTTPPTVEVRFELTRATADDRATAASILQGFDWTAAP